MKIYIHEFKGYWGTPSACKVYITKINGITIVGLQDLSRGTSVTNASEQIATEITLKENLNPETTRWFEWYDEGSKIDEIFYEWDGRIAIKVKKWEHKEVQFESIKNIIA